MNERFQPAVEASAIPPDSSHAVNVAGISLLICNSDGKLFAIQNRCPHQGRPLEGGRVRRGTIACPLHGMRFELGSGKPLGQLTTTPLRTFPTRIVDGVIEVAID
jgi:3-phenylpropionate/trans-cinnamate dioxygenase ferredoxin subunit